MNIHVEKGLDQIREQIKDLPNFSFIAELVADGMRSRDRTFDSNKFLKSVTQARVGVLENVIVTGGRYRNRKGDIVTIVDSNENQDKDFIHHWFSEGYFFFSDGDVAYKTNGRAGHSWGSEQDLVEKVG